MCIRDRSRSKRLNEVDGKDYYFVSKEKFSKLENNNYFIESCNNFNNYYGSPIKNIKYANKLNSNILFDIDWKGARKIRKQFKKNDVIDIFILPPSVKELKKRLIKRGRDCLLYTSPSPRDLSTSRMPSSA